MFLTSLIQLSTVIFLHDSRFSWTCFENFLEFCSPRWATRVVFWTTHAIPLTTYYVNFEPINDSVKILLWIWLVEARGILKMPLVDFKICCQFPSNGRPWGWYRFVSLLFSLSSAFNIQKTSVLWVVRNTFYFYYLLMLKTFLNVFWKA